MFEAEVGIELDPERLTRLVHFDPHRFWLAFLAARLSSELVKTLNGKLCARESSTLVPPRVIALQKSFSWRLG